MKRLPVQFVMLATSLSLAACTGNGVLSVAPPPSANPTLPLTESGSLQAITGTRSYTGVLNPDPLSGSSVTPTELGLEARGPRVTLSYNPTNGSYTIGDETGSASFAPGDRVSSANYLDTYQIQNASSRDELQVFGNIRSGASGTPPIALSYLTYGLWTHTNTVNPATRQTYILVGYPTGSTSMPKTGTASFLTMVAARKLESGPGFSSLETVLQGTSTFNADFATGTVNTTLALQGTNGTFTGIGTIATDQFSGTFSSSAPNFVSGDFKGGFFGPSAAEMGYAFAITKNNPDPYAGATVAPMNTWITGIVLGKKN